MQDSEGSGRAFLSRLFQILADVSQPGITRSAAASYAASFLARAAFLSDAFLIEHITGMARWCLKYCEMNEVDSQGLHCQQGGYAKPRFAEASPQGLAHQVIVSPSASSIPYPASSKPATCSQLISRHLLSVANHHFVPELKLYLQ